MLRVLDQYELIFGIKNWATPGSGNDDCLQSHSKMLLKNQILATDFRGKTPKQTLSESGAPKQTCPSSRKVFPFYTTDWDETAYSRIWEGAHLPLRPTLINLGNYAPFARDWADELQPDVMISGGDWKKDKFMQELSLFQSKTLHHKEICSKFENVAGLISQQLGGYKKVNESDGKIKLFKIDQLQYLAGLTPVIDLHNQLLPEEPWHQHTGLARAWHNSQQQLDQRRPQTKVQLENPLRSLDGSYKVCSDLLSCFSFSQETQSNSCLSTIHHQWEPTDQKKKSISRPERSKIQLDCAHHQRNTGSYTEKKISSPIQFQTILEVRSPVVSQDKKRVFETTSPKKRIVEKPYDHIRKSKRKLQCTITPQTSCTGGTGFINLMNSGAAASQSGFAQPNTGNTQTQAKSGCDTDVYGLTSSYNVLTDGACQTQSIWSVNLGSIQTVNTILFIENQFFYTNTPQFTYSSTWILSYRITLGDDPNGFLNADCVSLNTLTKGGWFPCLLPIPKGQYLSIVSTTERIAFSEIMAYTEYAIQIKAINPPVCPFCAAPNLATNALIREVTLKSASASLVETGLTDTNPTITFQLKAQIQIEAVVLLGAKDLNLQPYQTTTNISVKNFNDAEQSCTHISDYNTYTESNCSNFSGNTVIVQRQAPGLVIAGFGILSDCDCSWSSFDPAQFTTPFTDTYLSGNSLSTISGGSPVSVTISLTIPDTVSYVCGNADGVTQCGLQRQLAFTDNNVVVSIFPHKKVSKSCNTLTCTLTLANTVDADAQTWQLKVEISLTSYQTVYRAQNITVTVLEKSCTIQKGIMNLLNTDVQPTQSSYSVGYNIFANMGCNGISENIVNSELVATQAALQDPNLWGVKFPQIESINTILLIGPEAPNISNLLKTKVTFGSSKDPQTNPICIAEGQITDGGWYLCSGSGIYLALWSTTNSITFYEIMAYASFPIQWNSITQTWNTVQANPTFPAANVLSKIVVMNDADNTRQKCIASLPGTASSGSLSIGFKAQQTIKAIVLVPGRNLVWKNDNQKDVTVKVTDVAHIESTCGIISDYNTYAEKECNKSGNLVTLSRSAANVQLSFCSIGIFSDCACSKSSFDSAHIYPYPNLDSILSVTSVNVTVGTSQSTKILINLLIPDTVSSVCGNADGKSYCERIISFTDEATGQAITSWPYKDFSYVSGILILNPVTAQTTKIKVSISLVSNPVEKKFEVLTAIVKSLPEAQYIPNQKLSATVKKTAQQQLPRAKLPSTFKILSNQNFATEVNGNLLTVLSEKDSDYGQIYFVSMSSVPNDASMPISYFSVQVTFVAEQKKDAKPSAGDNSNSTATNNTTDQNQGVAKVENYQSTLVSEYQKPVEKGGIVKDLPHATVKFTKLNPKGKMTINFSRAIVMPTYDNKEMTSLLFDASKGLTFESTAKRNLKANAQRDRRVPNLELSIDFDQDELNHTAYSFFVSNITENNITVQADFEYPILVSSGRAPDKLTIKINSFAIFKTSDRKDVQINENQATQMQQLPSMQVNATAFVGAVAKTASDTTQIVFIALMIGKTFFDFGLQGLDDHMKALGLLLHLMCAGLMYPQVMSAFFGPLLSFLLIDIIPLSDWLQQGFDWTITPYTPNFDGLGYNSGYILYNLGSLSMILVLTPIFALILRPLQKSQWLHAKIRAWATKKYEELVWNGLIEMIDGEYLILLLCVLVNIKTFEGDWGKDMLLNNIFCILSFFVVVSFPIVLLSLTWHYYDQIMDEESELFKKIGGHMEGYHKKRNHKRVVMASRFMQYPKFIVLCLAFVFLTDDAWAVISINNFTTLYEIMFVVYFYPHEDPMVNFFYVKANIVLMLFNYHMLCLTPFVPDTEMRYYIGCSACALVALDILIAVINWAKDTYPKIARFIRRKCIYEPNLKKINEQKYNDLVRKIKKRVEAGETPYRHEDYGSAVIQGVSKRQRKIKQSRVVPTSGVGKIVKDKTFIDNENDSDWGIKISPRLLNAPKEYLRKNSDCFDQFYKNIRNQWGQKQESPQNNSELENQISDDFQTLDVSWHRKIPKMKLIMIPRHEVNFFSADDESKQELPSYVNFHQKNDNFDQEIDRICEEISNELRFN